MNTAPQPDPIRAHQRSAIAARRVGQGARCACGEARPDALIPGSEPKICAGCQRVQKRKHPTDFHHVAGRRNSAITIPVPVNDHRAVLSPAQFDWPKETLENPTGDELLKIAGSLRGYIDTNSYLLDTLLRPLPEMLEALAKKKWSKTPKKKDDKMKGKRHEGTTDKQKKNAHRSARVSSATKNGARQTSR